MVTRCLHSSCAGRGHHEPVRREGQRRPLRNGCQVLETGHAAAQAQVVNSLLNSMLNPADSRAGVKLFRQLTGQHDNGTKWLRIKAEGNGKSVDGTVVDTTFWVQFVQSDARLALVAVGYPTTQQDAVAQTAYHTVITLEMDDASGPAAPAGAEINPAGVRPPGPKKDSAGGLRQQ